mmetsp:Transcript_25674/g.35459  ORF Transcript_25674/g.35459 Transcript_25674/m.35459 type:complete len:438 (-) Transcript_25674:64-1377(-)
MRVKVSLVSYGHGAEQAQVYIECGSGEQVLRWLAYTACSRLAYLRGDTPNMYVPQSVLSQDGTLNDPDTVLNEILEDGSSITVEFSSGPEAFKSRWEGRPRTPPFQWGEEGEIGASEHEWLEEMDLRALGVDKLVSQDLISQNPAALQQDLAATKDVLRQYAGGLQALYKYYETLKEDDYRALDKMSLDQFRALMQDAKVTTDMFKSIHVDECFSKSQDVVVTRTDKKPTRETASLLAMTIQEFFVCVIWVAGAKYKMALEGPSWGYSELSQKVSHLITDYLFPNLGNALTERLKAFDAAITPNSTLLLKKGRRLTEQTLDSCQLRRIASSERRLDVKYLCTHLKKWNILGSKGIDVGVLAIILLFAKHPDPDINKMELKKHPLEVNYDEFERLLLALAFKMYMSEENSDEPFEEYLGETLDDIYKKAGVLVEMKKF